MERCGDDPTILPRRKHGDRARRYKLFGQQEVVREGALGLLVRVGVDDLDDAMKRRENVERAFKNKRESRRKPKSVATSEGVDVRMNYDNFTELRYAILDKDIDQFYSSLSPESQSRYDGLDADTQLTLVALSGLRGNQLQELLGSQIPQDSPLRINENLSLLGELKSSQ